MSALRKPEAERPSAVPMVEPLELDHPLGDLPVIAIDLPVVFEDEGQDEMGDAHPHTVTEAILRFGIMAHLAARPRYRVFSNMNLYYHPVNHWAYVSPDVMVVVPRHPLADDIRSYRIGEHGPAPVLTVEVLSARTAFQGDLSHKPDLYRNVGVREYILIDITTAFLEHRLEYRDLDPFGNPSVVKDTGAGITSQLGFRVVIEPDGLPRVVDAATGWAYPRPGEADALARQRADAEARVRELEAELARLKGQPPAPGTEG